MNVAGFANLLTESFQDRMALMALEANSVAQRCFVSDKSTRPQPGFSRRWLRACWPQLLQLRTGNGREVRSSFYAPLGGPISPAAQQSDQFHIYWTWIILFREISSISCFLVKFRIPGVATVATNFQWPCICHTVCSQWCDQVGSRNFDCMTFRDLRQFDVFCGSLTLFCGSFAGNSWRFWT